ncbi:hypothetical protein JKP88DRAFT_292327 [Tribonema minus]|uniref:Uncharacterized protein n=1 Tax=Tribonema minus TaxID=303371 RepID=A0A835ZKS4_9STRA|nr:hypothetical protein JKP88DRAFT_292327 [Tribonema minus]
MPDTKKARKKVVLVKKPKAKAKAKAVVKTKVVQKVKIIGGQGSGSGGGGAGGGGGSGGGGSVAVVPMPQQQRAAAPLANQGAMDYDAVDQRIRKALAPGETALDAVQSQLRQASTLAAEHGAQFNRLTGRVQAIDDVNARLQDDMRANWREHEAHANRFDAAEDQMARLTGRADALDRHVTNIHAARVGMNARLGAMDAAHRELGGRVTNAEVTMNGLSAGVGQLHAQMQEASNVVAANRQETGAALSGLNADLMVLGRQAGDAHQASRDALQGQINNMAGAAQAAFDDVRGRVGNVAGAVDQVAGGLGTLRDATGAAIRVVHRNYEQQNDAINELAQHAGVRIGAQGMRDQAQLQQQQGQLQQQAAAQLQAQPQVADAMQQLQAAAAAPHPGQLEMVAAQHQYNVLVPQQVHYVAPPLPQPPEYTVQVPRENLVDHTPVDPAIGAMVPTVSPVPWERDAMNDL